MKVHKKSIRTADTVESDHKISQTMLQPIKQKQPTIQDCLARQTQGHQKKIGKKTNISI